MQRLLHQNTRWIRSVGSIQNYSNKGYLGSRRFELQSYSNKSDLGSQRLPKYKALFVDAFGTLISPIHSIPYTYHRFAVQHGISVSEEEISQRFKEAFSDSSFRGPTNLRYDGNGKQFWKSVIQYTTKSKSEALFEDLYQHFTKGEAWNEAEGASEALSKLKENGIKRIVVSNFDTRLRSILNHLELTDLLDGIIISAEVCSEKPDRGIFVKALETAQCRPNEVIHVGDHLENDVKGAQEMGMDVWLYGRDVRSFKEIVQRILNGKE